MNRISILCEETSNKIAAGEVVERPSSVVKELVENSIDAGASNIVIEIEDGGQKLIRISDDGHGIHPEDIEKAFLPHGTSKINTIEDIYILNTFGFRGEALASIAAVSKIQLRSKLQEQGIEHGKEISIEGGCVKYITDAPSNIGTIIEVRDLFYNVPARLKFLKSQSREAALINDIVQRISLANNHISFKLISNGKSMLKTVGNGELKDTIRVVYGKNIWENIIHFEKHTDICSIYGYIGNREICRGSRNHQTIFVNKRYVKNKVIGAAVENAYKSFVTVNKFPFFILFIDIYPEFVDVNVHPTKSEVKFSDEREIYKGVFDTVHEALRDNLKESFQDSFMKQEQNEEEIHQYISEIPNDISTKEKTTVQLSIDLKPKINSEDIIKVNEEFISKENVLSCNENYIQEVPKEQYKTPKFGEFKIIGSFNKTYIIAESNDQLYLIDQHAAHEKILFEKYMKEIKNSQVLVQGLLTPIVLELSGDDYGYYKENEQIFKDAGFKIEPFGDNTITIREVPMFLGKPEVKDLFMNLLDDLKNMGSGDTITVKYNKIATLACKSAVKAKDYLTIDHMKSLIENLRYIDDPFTCPHGRPTMIKFSLTDIEKKFKRII